MHGVFHSCSSRPPGGGGARHLSLPQHLETLVGFSTSPTPVCGGWACGSGGHALEKRDLGPFTPSPKENISLRRRGYRKVSWWHTRAEGYVCWASSTQAS